MTVRPAAPHWLMLLGALGIFFGNANPALHLPLAALLYPACLGLLAREEYPFRRGWLCGLAGSAAALYWISWAVHDYGAFPWPLAVPCAVLPGAWVGLWGGLFCACLSRLSRAGNFSMLRRALAAGLLWYLLEWTRGWFATGFPWLTLGAAQARWPLLIQGASVIGDYGLSGLYAGMACLAADLVRNMVRSMRRNTAQNPAPGRSGEKRRGGGSALSAGVLVLLALLIAGFGAWRLERLPLRDPLAASGSAGGGAPEETGSTASPGAQGLEPNSAPTIPPSIPLTIALIQGNVPQDIKWVPSFQAGTVDKYLGLSRMALAALSGGGGGGESGLNGGGGPDLVVWPETSMPFYFQLGGELPERLREFARERGVWLLFGGPARQREETPDAGQEHSGSSGTLRNRAFLLDPWGMPAGHYDKRHLVPFGEYIPPFLDLPLFEPLLQGVGGFSPGEENPPLVVRNRRGERVRLGMLICYEAIFPEIARAHVAAGADALLNISNDGWYGKSSAPAQHLYLSVMRAVEQRRWLARGTNTGLTAFADPAGRLWTLGGADPESAAGLFENAWLTGHIWPERERSIYFFLHPWLPALALALLLLVSFPACRRPRAS